MHTRKFIQATLICIDLLLLAMVFLFAVNIVSSNTSFSEVPSVSKPIFSLLTLINSERVSNKLSPLVLDTSLTTVAQNYSVSMAQKNFFSHISPSGQTLEARLQASDVSFTEGGENIAYAPTLKIAHQNLMRSKEHRENILNPKFKKIGLGITNVSKNKKIITEVFTD